MAVIRGWDSLVTHVVIFRWIADATPQQVGMFADALERMAADVADLATIQHGSDLGFRDANGDYAIAATFRDRAGWDAYQAHPKHKAFVQDFATPLQTSSIAIQFEDRSASR